MSAERLHRRREDRVIACLRCGTTLAIYIEGDRVPGTPHDCPELDLNDLNDTLAELKAARGEDDGEV
jgi:hypothetical protein